MTKVLVVDDEPLCRQGVVDFLRLRGIKADAASDGHEALRLFRRHPHRLVISDLSMPGLDGLGLMRTVKREAPTTRFVLLSGVGKIATAVAALREGADDFLEKPISREQLEALLQNLDLSQPAATGIVTRNALMLALLERARKIAPTEATVLIQGESGTGKELVAAAIHGWSQRASGPFVALNCAAMPETLVEAELFGHERGAFTDARVARAGVIEQADGGTLFLDEIGEMPPGAQAKLLRVLQDRCVRRIGAEEAREVRVRFIAATNRSLPELVREKRFRDDLYFRLNVMALDLPALRERPDDVAVLVEHFARKWGTTYGRPAIHLSPEALARLSAHPWPGNVRELENVVHRAVIEADGAVILPAHLKLDAVAPVPSDVLAGRPWDAVQKDLIMSTLAQVGGNRRRAAELLGIGERTLRNRLREYRLSAE